MIHQTSHPRRPSLAFRTKSGTYSCQRLQNCCSMQVQQRQRVRSTSWCAPRNCATTIEENLYDAQAHHARCWSIRQGGVAPKSVFPVPPKSALRLRCKPHVSARDTDRPASSSQPTERHPLCQPETRTFQAALDTHSSRAARAPSRPHTRSNAAADIRSTRASRVAAVVTMQSHDHGTLGTRLTAYPSR